MEDAVWMLRIAQHAAAQGEGGRCCWSVWCWLMGTGGELDGQWKIVWLGIEETRSVCFSM